MRQQTLGLFGLLYFLSQSQYHFTLFHTRGTRFLSHLLSSLHPAASTCLSSLTLPRYRTSFYFSAFSCLSASGAVYLRQHPLRFAFVVCLPRCTSASAPTPSRPGRFYVPADQPPAPFAVSYTRSTRRACAPTSPAVSDAFRPTPTVFFPRAAGLARAPEHYVRPARHAGLAPVAPSVHTLTTGASLRPMHFTLAPWRQPRPAPRPGYRPGYRPRFHPRLRTVFRSTPRRPTARSYKVSSCFISQRVSRWRSGAGHHRYPFPQATPGWSFGPAHPRRRPRGSPRAAHATLAPRHPLPHCRIQPTCPRVPGAVSSRHRPCGYARATRYGRARYTPSLAPVVRSPLTTSTVPQPRWTRFSSRRAAAVLPVFGIRPRLSTDSRGSVDPCVSL